MNKKEPFTKICENCGCEFETKNTYKKCCSASCGQKLRYKDPDDRKKWSEKMKLQNANLLTKEKIRNATIKRWERDGEHERMSKKMKEYKASDEFQQKKQFIYNDNFKKRAAEQMKKQWNDPDYIEKMKKIHESDEFRNKMREIQKQPHIKKRISESSKERWEDDEYRTKMSQRMYEMWKDEEYRKHISDKRKEKWEDAEYRTYMSMLSKNRWNDADWVDSHFKQSVAYKNFKLPSGRIIKLQGYEPRVLEQLLKIYTENDIVCGVKNINNEIGKITYIEDGVEHRYYPDFYIKSTNTIIEVKSQWTFDKWKKKNELKKNACISLGFNFKFEII